MFVDHTAPEDDLERRFLEIARGLPAAGDDPEPPAEPFRPFDRLVAMVQRCIGFRDSPTVRQKIASFIQGDDDETAATWLRRLEGGRTCREDWQRLLQVLTVPETFFYRDQPQLDVLRSEVLPELVRSKARQSRPSLRLWSAACSTGEECYTLAMMVMDALVAAGEALETPAAIQPAPHWQVSVIGTDVAVRSLEAARAGIYREFGLSAFRDLPACYRRFFVPVSGEPGMGAHWAVRADLRRIVWFQHHNLVDDQPPGDDFDVVLCRNVMIYFDDWGKRRATRTLDRAVSRQGVIALGPTDDASLLRGYEPLTVRTSPLLRKQGKGDRP